MNPAALGACALLALTTPTPAVPPPTGVAPLNAPAGGFAIDGDLLSRMPVGTSGDWVVAPALPGTGEGVLSPAGVPLNSLATFHFIDPYDSSGSDIIFTGGSKWADNPNTWVWTTGKPSSKTDINNVLLHLATDDLGHTWAVISADRASTSGDSYIDFELLQRPLVRTNNGNFFSSGPHAGRTTNDLVLSLAFTEGGKVADFFAWRWQADGVGGFRYVDVTAALPSGRVFVALNTNTIPVPYTAFGGNQYQANAFAEAAIDLTALLGGFDPCESFGFETITVKTKASASYSAGIEDLIEPIAYKLRIGPAANAGPDQTRCAEPGATVFPLQGSASAGLTSVASTRWSVVAGSAVIDNPDALVTTAQVASRQATIRLEVVQANGCTDIDDVVLSAVEPPALAIGGPTVLCPDTTALFSAPPGMQGYQWSVSGNATLMGATNQQTVLVLSSNLCDEPFELTLVASSNVCTVAAQAEVQVQDTVPPVLTLPGDLLLECPADTRTNATGAATAQDDCGSVTVSYTDAQTNLCGGSRIIAREWTAMDSCGNTTSGIQTITVQDTTRPTLSIPPSITLECPANTAPTATGVATAQDNCGTPTVSFADAVTTGCGGSKTIARTWSAIDECGNVATATQTITVRDTTRPTLSIPPSVTLECPANTAPTATGVATAQDNCGTPAVSFSDAVTAGCGGSKTIARTWSATDECGNVATAVQTITVQDTTRPTLSIPPSVTLELPAHTAPIATGVATAQDNCGTPAVSFSDAVTAGCGGSKTIARTWSATDECGNVATAIQTITVRDTTAPTLTPPANITLECPADTRTNVTGRATATDASGWILTYNDVMTAGACAGTMSIARTWTATDACGNTTSRVQTILVQDTIPPKISAPNLTVQCADDVPSAHATLAAFLAAGGKASDTCDATLAFALASDSGLVGSCPGTVTRVYRVSDDCGNVAECIQVITVDDTQAPLITCPGSVTVECGDSIEPTALGTATATDNCDPNASVDYTDVPVPSQYLIKWYAADPDLNTGPYAPTYVKLAPASLPCPESASLTGRALAPLRNAVAYSAPGGQLDALTSLGGEPIARGQLVPFEAVIEVSGGPGPERGTLEFTSSWSTHTTSNDRFGYDTNYMVYCAFVDFSDPGTLDPNANARVESFHSTLLNPGSIDEKILGTFRISGLESGDRVVVEIWVVLSSQMPSQVGGTIASDLVSAEKATVPPQPISTGAQTVSIGNLSKIKPLPAPQPQGPEPVLPPQPPALPGATVSMIDRTWRATDDCGNRNTCVQRITVRDTTPPQFVEAQALQVIEPAALWTPEPPEAVDGCGEVTVRIFAMETNLTASGSHVVTTTWEAIDESGNRTLMNSQVEIQPLILPNPELKFGVLDGRLVLSWSAQPAGWWLESAANLAQPRWKPVAIAPTLSSNRYVVELDPAGAQQSYRLATGTPPLALSPATPGKVALTWPALAAPHTVQRCTELASGLWTNQPASVVSTNGLNRVELEALGSRAFFRLVKPTP